jgi:hypothetical protein
VPILDGLGDWQEDLLDRRSLRSALRNWDQSQKLGEHPLARLRIVDRQRRVSGYRETSIGYGIALREVIQDAINKLNPADGDLDYSSKRCRPFLILCEQFIHGRSPDYVCELLGIARSTYNHEQARALEMLIDLLKQRETIWEEAETESAGAIAERTPARAIPFLAPPRPHYAIVGREEILRDLKERITSSDGSRVAAIHGLPGVGKTALAIELANNPDVIAYFEDGILWAGLGRRLDRMALLSF